MTNGEVVFEDDASIEAGDPVWRRIPPGYWTFDHNLGRVRPTSQCFQYSTKEDGTKHPMSVTLGRGLTADAALAGHDAAFKLVGWTAEYVRRWVLGVCRDEQPHVVAHGLVFTLQQDAAGKRKNNISGSVKDKLSVAAQWVIELSPEEVDAARQRTTAP